MVGSSLYGPRANTFRRTVLAASMRPGPRYVETTVTTSVNSMRRQNSTSRSIFAIMKSFCATASNAFRVGTNNRLRLALLFAGVASPTASPAQVGPHIHVSVRGGAYRMYLQLHLKAPIARVYAALTDYSAIQRLNPAVKRSELIQHNGLTLLRMHIKSCVLFICFPVTQTEAMSAHKPTSIRGTIIPALSSFKSGFSRWRLRTDKKGTEADFRAVLVPSFYIPPFLDAWIIKNKLRTEMRTTAAHLKTWVEVTTPYTASDLQKARLPAPQQGRP